MAPLHPWEWPGKPWNGIHIDYARPFQGNFSGYCGQSLKMTRSSCYAFSFLSNQTLDNICSFGLIVSDNGTSFTSQEFQIFLKQNEIQHMLEHQHIIHRPMVLLNGTNVQTVKEGLKKITSGSMESRVARLLSCYRVAP